MFIFINIAEASLVAQMVKNSPEMQETWVRSLFRKIPWGLVIKLFSYVEQCFCVFYFFILNFKLFNLYWIILD